MINRYVCSAIDEARKAINSLNIFTIFIAKRHLISLIEEIQTAVNRMENHLEMRKEVEYYEEKYRNLKKQIKELQLERNKLKEELPSDAEDEYPDDSISTRIRNLAEEFELDTD